MLASVSPNFSSVLSEWLSSVTGTSRAMRSGPRPARSLAGWRGRCPAAQREFFYPVDPSAGLFTNLLQHRKLFCDSLHLKRIQQIHLIRPTLTSSIKALLQERTN